MFAATLLLSMSALTAELVIPFELHKSQSVIVVEGTVNGRETRFILDTGASRTLIATDVLMLSPGSLPRSTFGSEAGLWVSGKILPASVAIAGGEALERNVGVVRFDDIRGVYGKAIGGILGQDFLRQFETVQINFRKRELTLGRP